MKKLLWKVCGMRETENIEAVLALKPDFMGFIFYKKSARFVAEQLDEELLKDFPENTTKVGVFVNAEISDVLKLASEYTLSVIQLHGSESPEYCKELSEAGLQILKAFSVDKYFDFEVTKAYSDVCDLFLFDTKAEKGYGGHGKTFDWALLKQYKFDTPFLLAGGIELENIDFLTSIKNPAFYGIDVNSKFEIEPAFKNIEMLTVLKDKLASI